MLRPFLLVGIGGSGGKTLRTVRTDLEQRLEEIGYQGDFPECWQMVHIDVPTSPDGDDPDLPEQLPSKDYVGLVGKNITYKVVDAALASFRGGQSDAVLSSLVGWRPDPVRVAVDVTKGAGQYRTLGRVITVCNLDDIAGKLREAIGRLSGLDVAKQLGEVSRLLGVSVEATVPDPVFVVAASLAGGSGAGAFLDVCDAARAIGPAWTSNSVAMLYAPDVFDHIPDERRKGVQANALASLSEVLAGYWNQEDPAVSEFALLERAAVQPGAIDRRGPRYPFLVGAANDQVRFPAQNDVYRSIGKALAAWVASAELQDQIDAYLSANWMAAATAVPDHLPLKNQGQESPFNALGFARVSLGRDRFATYAAEWLARAAAERVLRQHLANRDDDEDPNLQVAIEEAATNSFATFLQSSGLDERGEERNDIVDALRPRDRKERMTETVASVKAKLVVGHTKGLPARQWATAALELVVAQGGKFSDVERGQRLELARSWVSDTQVRLTELVSMTVAAQGAPVTSRLLERLEDELNFVLVELAEEAEKLEHWAAKQDEMVRGAITSAGDDTLMPENPQIEQGIRKGVECMEWRAEAQLRRFAVELLRDFQSNFIRPLRKAVARGNEALSVAEQSRPDGRPSVLTMWPEGDRVPRRLHPAANEFVIAPVAEYPSVLTDLLRATARAKDAGGARVEALRAITTGTESPQGADQRLIEITTNWIPRTSDLQPDGAPATDARFNVRLAPEDLLARAKEWIHRPDTLLGDYLSESLDRFLDPEKVKDPSELNDRLNKFRAAFMQALNAAGPLVSINNQTLQAIHDKDSPAYDLNFTEIPFSDGSEGRAIIEDVLRSRDQWDNDFEKAFVDGPQARIDIFTMLREPYEPVVFDSIVKPIANEWAARQLNADQRTEFWRWRRSRPLPHFIPTSPGIRRAMIRGWFTARLLNQIQADNGRTHVWVPDRSAFVSFPHPLLGPDIHEEYERLPALLESLPLALIEVGSRGVNGPAALEPYLRLRDLGQDARGREGDYQVANATLAGWVLEGMTDPGSPTPPSHAGAADGTWEERRTASDAYLAELEKNYGEIFAQVPTRDGFFDMPRVWELRTDYVQVLKDLRQAIGHVKKASDDKY